MKRVVTYGVSLAMVFALASSARAVPASFGVNLNNVIDLNAGFGSGAEVLCTNWNSQFVQGSKNWTDGVYSLTISNQNAASGARSFWNPGSTNLAGTDICKGSGKVHYYAQNEKIVGLDTLGWASVDIYVYGHSGPVEIVSTNPGNGYGGTVVTNGDQQTMTYDSTLTTYVNGAGGSGNYLKFSNISPLSTLWVTMSESQWSAIQVVQAGPPAATWPGYIPGDFNKDGQVGPEDFGILKEQFGVSGLAHGNHDSWTLGDANDDGQVGPEDFGLLRENFGTSGGPTGAYPLSNVPEPATLALLALGGLLAARGKRR